MLLNVNQEKPADNGDADARDPNADPDYVACC